MGDAVIVAAARTAIGTARKGSLVDVSAFDLARFAIAEALRRSGVAQADVDDVIMGESMQGGGDIARYVAVEMGIEHVPGAAMNRHCASGLTAVQTAAAGIRAGMDKVVIAGGTESISTTPACLKRPPGQMEPKPWMSPSHPATEDAPAFDMSITVGWNAARAAGVSRQAMDEWAYHSHIRALRATDEGRFRDEIFPIQIQDRDGATRTFEVDEHPRRTTTPEKLAALPPLHPEIEGFSITAGNSSGLNDGAAAVVVVDAEYAKANGLKPLAVIKSWASVGVPPARTGLAPTLAIPKALKRAGMTTKDIALWEINEAFCSMAVACTEMLGLDHDTVNVNGSGCGLGHPIACTGARMVVTMVHELARRGGGHGVVSMCAGGGMGSAAVLEVMPS
jgi:acetyl-CoA acetyltransferase family protein